VLQKKIEVNFQYSSKLQCRIQEQKSRHSVMKTNRFLFGWPLVRVQFSSRKFNPTTDAFFSTPTHNGTRRENPPHAPYAWLMHINQIIIKK
jgi:hypothetical protein